MSNKVTKAVEAIYNLETNDQLNQVIEAIKMKRTYLANMAIRSFMVGDMVQFKGRTGGAVNATVEKVNKKYVIVSTHIGGEKWRVPATHLTKLSDIGVKA